MKVWVMLIQTEVTSILVFIKSIGALQCHQLRRITYFTPHNILRVAIPATKKANVTLAALSFHPSTGFV